MKNIQGENRYGGFQHPVPSQCDRSGAIVVAFLGPMILPDGLGDVEIINLGSFFEVRCPVCNVPFQSLNVVAPTVSAVQELIRK